MAESNRQDCMRDYYRGLFDFFYNTTDRLLLFARRALSFPPGVELKK